MLLGEAETGPGLWGFVAKHLFRAGEFESTQEKGQTKNNPGVKQAEPVCAVETSNRETWKRKQRVRNDPELATLLESRALLNRDALNPEGVGTWL